MDAQNEYQVDLGNLMAFDPFHHFTSIPSARSVVFFFNQFIVLYFHVYACGTCYGSTRNLYLNLLSAVKF